jgi:glycogen operon protein
MSSSTLRSVEPTRSAAGARAAVAVDMWTPGDAAPIGATVVRGGVNFSIFSRTATAIDLLVFDNVDDAKPAKVIPLDPVANRTYHYWHTFVPGLRAGQVYAYRAAGPFDPPRGLRFCAEKLLLDPYGRGVAVPDRYDREGGKGPGNNTAAAMKSIVVDPFSYDWEGDAPLRHPASRTIIYEMHVGGFTRHPSSGIDASRRGTYAGLIEKIPYLKDLGVTAVELLPVFQFDAQDGPPGLVNYWGYHPVSFFSPHRAYSSRTDALGPADEFRDMVKALHRAGIEVILDVVFNHTAEGKHDGPTFCFRGLDNATYYILDPADPSRYADFSGCGNTLNANNPIVRRMIVDSIRYWVERMHVDGFRFDLASILARDPAGNVMPSPPVLWDLETDPLLAGTKFIAEAWDAAGLYQVGSFVGESWREWNGRFRDDARAFFRGDRGSLRRFADRFVGSPEVYQHKQREPEQSVNFVSCHDGFTLNDLVSYNAKHNESNGESNRDGGDDNLSWNCGVEGPTDDATIESLRNRQVKNFLTTTLLSIGLPMILMGDEARRSQGGNNNNYCHDDASNWFDWSLLERHADVHRFVQLLCARRTRRATAHERERLTLADFIQRATKSWHGVRLNAPDWGDASHAIAFGAELREDGMLAHLILNAYWDPLAFELPRSTGVDGGTLRWRRWIDTALPTPHDIAPWQDSPAIPSTPYRAGARSVVMLFADIGDGSALNDIASRKNVAHGG